MQNSNKLKYEISSNILNNIGSAAASCLTGRCFSGIFTQNCIFNEVLDFYFFEVYRATSSYLFFLTSFLRNAVKWDWNSNLVLTFALCTFLTPLIYVYISNLCLKGNPHKLPGFCKSHFSF